MLFSVIVPMYNVEKYAEECIKSVLAQTYRDFELILVDDGSTDRTPEMIDAYAGQDERIIAVHKENGGVVSARKAGCLKSTGDYIVPVDGDDWVHTQYLEKFAEVIEKHPRVELVCCECYSATDNGATIQNQWYKKYGLHERAYIESNLYPRLFSFPPSIWAKAFRRDLYEKNQLQVEDVIGMGEDMAVVFPYLMQIDSLYVLEDCLYYYRYNPDSMTKNKKKEFSTEGLLARIGHFEKHLPLGVYGLADQLAARAVHDAFNVILSYFRANPYSVAKKKAQALLGQDIVKKYVDWEAPVPDKKERVAKWALKHKMFWVIKAYSLLG